MNQNLDTLRTEVLQYLESSGFIVFHGEIRRMTHPVCWDAAHHSDFREFLATATACGQKLIVLFVDEFTRTQAEDALEDLEVADLPEEDYRSYTRRLKELRDYDGFTCALELSYSYDGITYLFHLHTDWFAEFLAIRSELDEPFPGDEGDDAMDGYFSKN